ncbi:MAG: CHC2 zinc finger domain-containing protein [Cyclobacteriaceae bacterium]
MEIAKIKELLPLAQVLDYYGLKPDKHLKLHCPFHEDKTPSLQVYYKTQTCYCFSANCKTHGKSLDVIDFILYMDGISKREAILKATSMISGEAEKPVLEGRTATLTNMFTYFSNAIHNSKPAKAYLQQRHLAHNQIEVGYNSGQFHHGSRRDRQLINSCLKYGLLLDKGHVNNKTGEAAYSPFGKGCLAFPLKDRNNQIVSMYFRSIGDQSKIKHLYLTDRQGLYPNYPSRETKKLILTESIIDGATLLQQSEITKDYEILALYGTNGLTKEHTGAVSQLKELEEIVLFLDGDEPGRKAAAKYKTELEKLQPKAKVRIIETPEGEDVNSLLDSLPHENGGHAKEIFTALLTQQTPVKNKGFAGRSFNEGLKTAADPQGKKEQPGLNTGNPQNLIFKTQSVTYQVKGFNGRQPLDGLKVTLQITAGQIVHRCKCDLYDDRQAEATAKKAAGKLNLNPDKLETDISQLTDLLETWRTANSQENQQQTKTEIQVPAATQAECLKLLKDKNLFVLLNELIGKSGVIGEDANRLLLFVIASTYKMEDTLHALVQGSSGSGKTHLVTKIAELMPPEHTLALTRVTESSFYNYQENELCNRLIILEDLDGLKEDAFLAFRELQSRGMLNSSTSVKDEQGNIRAEIKTVKGPISSLSATTKGAIYEDNMSRCLVIAVDESKDQTANIIKAQNQLAEGKINKAEQRKVAELLQNSIRLIKPEEVINPFASKVQLPEEAHKIRRLNQLYQAFVKQITLLHQYQRKRDPQGRLITEKKDLQLACRILFECIVLKVDELDGGLRTFFERLKDFLGNDQKTFTQREVRQQMRISKAQCSRSVNQLLSLEYLSVNYSGNQRKISYQIDYWDNYLKIRTNIKNHLDAQINRL